MMQKQGFFLLCLLMLCVGAAPSGIVFEDITAQSGIQPHVAGMMGHGAAWGDFNNDGHPDLFVGGFCDRPDSEYSPAKGPVPTRLFRNLGNGKFELVKNSPVEFFGRTSGAIFADFNNDSYTDLFVANHSRAKAKSIGKIQTEAQLQLSKLLKNSNGSFEDVTSSSGIPTSYLAARNTGVFDYNGDGLLDLLLIEDSFKRGTNARSLLMKNAGNFKFQIANAEAGIPDDIFGLGLAIGDLNEDRRADFFVARSNRLFLSQPGNRYKEAIELKPMFEWKQLDNEDWPCGAAFGDLNMDAKLDLVISIHHAPARNKVFLNRGLKNGLPVFQDMTESSGLETLPVKSPHVEIQDFDNDGYSDIYLSVGSKENNRITPLIYQNQGISKDDVPRFKSNIRIHPNLVYFPAGPTADFNRDGKLDVLLVNWFPNEHTRLLKNQTATGNWLQVKTPIGSTIRLSSGNQLIGYKQLWIGTGYGSGHVPILHFGVAHNKTVNVEAVLPNGSIKRLNNVSANTLMEIRN